MEDLPRATAVKAPADNDPLRGIVRAWIRWLPVSIAFFGLSFVVWTITLIVQVGRYHDALTKTNERVKRLEDKLKDDSEQRWGEYYHRQCVGQWGNEIRDEARAQCKFLEKE